MINTSSNTNMFKGTSVVGFGFLETQLLPLLLRDSAFLETLIFVETAFQVWRHWY